MTAATPPLTLTYFPFPGRAASILDAFAIGRIAYERENVAFDAWPALKEGGTLPWGGLPLLKVGGAAPMTLCQSDAILRYVGRLAGLYPADPMAALRVDQVLDCVTEMMTPMSDSIREQDVERRMAMRAQMAEVQLPRDFARLERLLEANVAAGGSAGHFVGDGLTIADLKVLHSVNKLTDGSLDGIAPEVIAPFKRLDAWRRAVEAARQARLAA